MFWDGDFIAKIIKGIIDAVKPEISEWITPRDRRGLKIIFVVLFILYAGKVLGL